MQLSLLELKRKDLFGNRSCEAHVICNFLPRIRQHRRENRLMGLEELLDRISFSRQGTAPKGVQKVEQS